MNMTHVHQLLVAADQQPSHGFEVAGSCDCDEVKCMAGAGLVEISDHGNRDRPTLTIERLTPIGHAFLRAFNLPPPLPVARAKEKRIPVDLPPFSGEKF